MAPLLEGRAGLFAVDLGCGTGLSGAILRPHAGRLVGVDLSGAMLEQAGKRGLYDELVREEIGDWLERERGRVDVALALDVFIYVGELARVMRALSAALVPGGLVAFTTEHGVLGHRHVDQQIAGSAAAYAGVTLRGDAHPRTISDGRRDANRERFRSRFHTLAMAGRTFLLLQPPFPAAGGAGLRKHHVSADRP